MDFLHKIEKDSIRVHYANQNMCVMKGTKKNAFSQTSKPAQLGVYIYAYARELMYNNIYRYVDAFYTDTDSCLMSYADYLKLRSILPQMFTLETREFSYEKNGQTITKQF